MHDMPVYTLLHATSSQSALLPSLLKRSHEGFSANPAEKPSQDEEIIRRGYPLISSSIVVFPIQAGTCVGAAGVSRHLPMLHQLM